MRRLLLFLFVILLLPKVAWATVLSDAADAMAPDTWAVLNTNGIDGNTLIAQGSSGFLTGDASGGCWDPVRQEAHFIGMDHQPGTIQRHVIYDAATNTWVRLSDPPFGVGTINHNWESMACDARGRFLYRMNIASLNVWRMNLDTRAWTNLGAPPSGVMGYPNGFPGLAWYYERGRTGQLVITGQESGTSGALIRYDPDTNTFTRISASLLSGFPDANSFAEYSEVHRRTLFGNDTTARLLDARGNLTTIAAYPGCVPDLNRDGIIHADPVTGNFVMLCGGGAASWHIYNPITNAWTTKATPSGVTNHILNVPSTAGTWPTWGKIGIPITDHGVIMYVACNTGGCAVRLYRGGTFSTADRDFKRRCYKPGVVNCWGFDSVNDVNGTTVAGVTRFASGASTPVLQSSVKASGLQAIDMTVPSVAGADTSGAWHDNFRDDMSNQFNAGGEFYVQYRWRATPCFLYVGSNDAECAANGAADPAGNRRQFAGGGGWKLSIIGSGDRTGVQRFSCTDLETVVQNTDHLGFAQMYRSCAGPFAFNPLNEPINTNFYLQNTNRSLSSSTGCFYPGPYAGCFRFFPNEWMTIQVRVKVSDNWYNGSGCSSTPCPHTSGIVEMWVARAAGQPSQKVLSYTPRGLSCDNATGTYIPGCGESAAGGTGLPFWRASSGSEAQDTFGKIWLLPYNTGRSSSVSHPEAHVYYDEVIVSTQPIADPGAVSPTDGTPPSPPTGFRLSHWFQELWQFASTSLLLSFDDPLRRYSRSSN